MPRDVQADHDRGRPAEPPLGGRARDAEIGRDGHIPGAVDELAKPVVIALLRASRRRHRTIIGRSRTPLNPNDATGADHVRTDTATRTHAEKSRMSAQTARRTTRLSVRDRTLGRPRSRSSLRTITVTEQDDAAPGEDEEKKNGCYFLGRWQLGDENLDAE